MRRLAGHDHQLNDDLSPVARDIRDIACWILLETDRLQFRRHEPGDLEAYCTMAYWGRGLATEAARAFVRSGFESLGLHRIEAGINAQNHASIRVIEKLGFQLVRTGETDGTRWLDFELRAPGA